MILYEVRGYLTFNTFWREDGQREMYRGYIIIFEREKYRSIYVRIT